MTDDDVEDRMRAHYGRVAHADGPKIYTREDVFNAIYNSGKFGDLPRDAMSEYIDLMCGKGCLVAKAVNERAEQQGIPLHVYCLDVVFENGKLPDDYETLKEKGFVIVPGTVKEIPFDRRYFDRATSRFGVKNYPPEEQKDILLEIRRVIKDSGYFVLTDMETDPETYEWAQAERLRKRQRTIGEGFHHIPTREMWYEMLRDSGLEPELDGIYRTVSLVVPTRDWVKSNQMPFEQAAEMEEFFKKAPQEVKKFYGIKEKEVDGQTRIEIEYPVVIIPAKAV